MPGLWVQFLCVSGHIQESNNERINEQQISLSLSLHLLFLPLSPFLPLSLSSQLLKTMWSIIYNDQTFRSILNKFKNKAQMSPSHISVKCSNGGPSHFEKRKQEIRVTHIRQKKTVPVWRHYNCLQRKSKRTKKLLGFRRL